MTSPVTSITEQCPHCGNVSEDWYRPPVNLRPDDFGNEFPDECSTATCPEYGHRIEFDTLVVDKEWTFILPE